MYISKSTIVLTVFFMFIFVFFQNAHSLEFYSVKSPCELILINTDSNTLIPQGSVNHCIESFSFSPLGTLYATVEKDQCMMHGSANTLVTLNPKTLDVAVIGVIGFEDVDAIAFDNNGTLYAVSADTDDLLRIDTDTGKGTVIGSVGYPFISTMAFSADNTLYAVDVTGDFGGASTLLRIDKNTATTTKVGDIGIDTIEGITFAQNGSLYGISTIAENGGTGDLVEINIQTGKGTPIMNIVTSGALDGLVEKIDNCSIIDTDKDGVINQLDQCQNTPINSFVDNKGCKAEGIFINQSQSDTIVECMKNIIAILDEIGLEDAIRALEISAGMKKK